MHNHCKGQGTRLDHIAFVGPTSVLQSCLMHLSQSLMVSSNRAKTRSAHEQDTKHNCKARLALEKVQGAAASEKAQGPMGGPLASLASPVAVLLVPLYVEIGAVWVHMS